MVAREKLNAVVLWGCLIVSALLGLAMDSWLAFFGILIVAIGGCCNAEGIRIRPVARRPSGGRGRRR